MNLKFHKVLKHFLVVLSLWVICKDGIVHWNSTSKVRNFIPNFYHLWNALRQPSLTFASTQGENKYNNICFLQDKIFPKIHGQFLKTGFEVLGGKSCVI